MQIKRMTAYTTYKGGERFCSAYTIFDNAGQILETADYTASDELQSKTSYTYDEKGRKTSEINYITEDEIGEHAVFSYNDDGKISEQKTQYADGSEVVRSYSYLSGNKILMVAINADGEQEEREQITTDNAGNEIEREIFDEDNKLKERYLTQYTPEGHPLLQQLYDNRNKLETEVRMRYNEHGDTIERATLSAKGDIIEKITYKYDDRRRVVEQRIGSRFLTISEYDDEQKTRLEKRTGADGMTEERLFHYNEQGLLLSEKNALVLVEYEYELA